MNSLKAWLEYNKLDFEGYISRYLEKYLTSKEG